ncbi:MAG: hypothetical protein J6C00_06020 [Eubacterium sp.]|nr:hypothetical protein [Eubacterium sp.]
MRNNQNSLYMHLYSLNSRHNWYSWYNRNSPNNWYNLYMIHYSLHYMIHYNHCTSLCNYFHMLHHSHQSIQMYIY